ncbi:MAG TPA: hypothetical protein DIC42_04025 [Holosporales bacterium]|nr:hypothetical protein [Holosporales bacterium]
MKKVFSISITAIKILFFISTLNDTMHAESIIHKQIEKLEHHKKILSAKLDADKNQEPISCKIRRPKKNAADSLVPKIRERLILRGYLDYQTHTGNVNNNILINALKTFQKANFLEQTGEFNTKTCEALNEPILEDLKLIEINLDRLNAVKEDVQKTKKLILVNVAQYHLFALKQGNVELEMDIIIGKKERKTIIGKDYLHTVVVNPTWTIPKQILLEDKLKVFTQDPGYLERKNYVIFDEDRNQLSPDQIDWNDVENNPLSYRFRQNAGENNVLGGFKFLLENKQAIYMHDTNTKDLFEKTVRTFSSGCIRLKNPEIMAEWLLKDYGDIECPANTEDGSSKYPLVCVKEIIGDYQEQKRQKFLKLTEKIPVILGYFTYWIDDDGLAYKSNDPYKRDDALLQLSLSQLIEDDVS